MAWSTLGRFVDDSAAVDEPGSCRNSHVGRLGGAVETLQEGRGALDRRYKLGRVLELGGKDGEMLDWPGQDAGRVHPDGGAAS